MSSLPGHKYYQMAVADQPKNIAYGEVVEVVGGFETYVPTMVPSKYEVLGDDMQVLSIKLDDGELVRAEPGSMNFMHPSVTMSVDCQNCWGRCCSGEHCIMANFTSSGSEGYVALTGAIPGKIIPIDMQTVGGKIRSKNGAYFASIGDARVSFDVDCSCLRCCCAGQGCVHQSIVGSHGTAFVSAMGTILQKELGHGETIVIDTNSLVAWQDSVDLGVRRAGGCCTCCCGGEGLFNTTLTGPGHIYIQSMSKEKFRAALAVAAGGAITQPVDEAGGPVASDTMER